MQLKSSAGKPSNHRLTTGFLERSSHHNRSPYRQGGHGLGGQGLVVVGSDDGTEEEQDLLMAVPVDTESVD
jgi:hypothetical protein